MLNKVLENVSTIAIGGHVRPDGDCVGSCVGLGQYIRENYSDKTVDIYLKDGWVKAEIIEKGQCVSLKELAVTGRDLIRAGMKPGKEIGEKLNELLNLVIENPEMNTKEILLKYSFPDKEV